MKTRTVPVCEICDGIYHRKWFQFRKGNNLFVVGSGCISKLREKDYDEVLGEKESQKRQD